jgi:hypothetical protein
MAATESHQGSNLAATSSTFTVAGGKFSLDVVGSWGSGSAQLELLGPDFSTWLNAGSSVTSNTIQTLDLPSGQYRVVITGGASAVYFALTKVIES